MTHDDVLNPVEAADLLHCSAYTCKDLVRKGLLPHFRIGNRILFRRSTLIDWMNQQELRSMTPKANDGYISLQRGSR